MRYEVCAESADAVLAAVAAGAHRVELCADLSVGGVTPSPAAVTAAVAAAGSRPVHVLIRPRAGDFAYSEAELAVMVASIGAARRAGAAGLVIGALTPDGRVDVPACEALVAAARPASVTFHRAFDETADPLAAFGQVLALGADRLLTSGAAETALAGADLIAELVRRAARQPAGKLTVLAGGGVTAANAGEIVARTGVSELHFSARPRPGDPPSLTDRVTAIIQSATSPQPS
jgi:copper homeostasis protein